MAFHVLLWNEPFSLKTSKKENAILEPGSIVSEAAMWKIHWSLFSVSVLKLVTPPTQICALTELSKDKQCENKCSIPRAAVPIFWVVQIPEGERNRTRKTFLLRCLWKRRKVGAPLLFMLDETFGLPLAPCHPLPAINQVGSKVKPSRTTPLNAKLPPPLVDPGAPGGSDSPAPKIFFFKTMQFSGNFGLRASSRCQNSAGPWPKSWIRPWHHTPHWTGHPPHWTCHPPAVVHGGSEVHATWPLWPNL